MGCVPTTRRINTRPAYKSSSAKNSRVEPRTSTYETRQMVVNEVVPNIITVPSTSATIYNSAAIMPVAAPPPTQVMLPPSVVTYEQPTPQTFRVNIPSQSQVIMTPQSVQRTFIPNVETVPPVTHYQGIQVQQMPAQSIKQTLQPQQFVNMQSQLPNTMNGMSTRLTGESNYQQNLVTSMANVQSNPSMPSAPSFPIQQPPNPMQQSFMPVQRQYISQRSTTQQTNDDLLRQLNLECADVNEENFQQIKVEKMEFGMKAY